MAGIREPNGDVILFEVAALREFFKLPKLEQKDRKCLRCRVVFKSWHYGHRLCHRCHSMGSDEGYTSELSFL